MKIIIFTASTLLLEENVVIPVKGLLAQFQAHGQVQGSQVLCNPSKMWFKTVCFLFLMIV